MYTIKEVADKMEISEHTLRFWAKSGFFPFIKRNENNIRLFSEDDLNWVKIVKCLRSIGTETKLVKRYIDLCIIGDSTIPERYEIIKTTKEKALQQMEELKDRLLTADDGRVIGILADDLPVLQAEECYTNKETEAAIGIIYNAPHKDEAVKYLLYLAGVK